MKKKLFFILVDAMLVLTTGLIFGLSCNKHIFSSMTGTLSFVGLLGTLFLPSLLYFINEKLNPAHKVMTFLFILAEAVVNIIFISKPSFGGMNFAITQGVTIGAYLISLLVVIAFYKIDDEENK